VLHLPRSFFPEYKHGWRVQCHRTQSRKNGPTKLIVLFDKYHGPLTALPKDMRNYDTRPKETVFEISPPSSGQDFSLRHALRLTYPTCTTMADVAQASAWSKGIFPSHPAVTFVQAAYTDPDLFSTYQDACSDLVKLKTAYSARMVGSMRIGPLQLPPRGSTMIPNVGSIGFTPKSRRAAREHPSWPLWRKAEDAECAGI
jgi:hypothetical protein